jgi:hypothetical protein
MSHSITTPCSFERAPDDAAWRERLRDLESAKARKHAAKRFGAAARA